MVGSELILTELYYNDRKQQNLFKKSTISFEIKKELLKIQLLKKLKCIIYFPHIDNNSVFKK